MIKAPPVHPLLKVYARADEYPKAWKKGRIQKLLLHWADRRCEHCGESGEDALLHVHHLRWQAKHDCRFENLVVLCVKHHTMVHNWKYQPFPKVDWQERWGEIPHWLLNRGLHQVWKDEEHSTSGQIAFRSQPGLAEAIDRLTPPELEIANRLVEGGAIGTGEPVRMLESSTEEENTVWAIAKLLKKYDS